MTIKSKSSIISKTIKIGKEQNVLDSIALKNGLILAITKTVILYMRINDNYNQICKLSGVPKESKEMGTSMGNILVDNMSIYELPNNNILISSTFKIRDSNNIHQFVYYTKEVIFSLDKLTFIKSLTNSIEAELTYKIIIYSKYICISKRDNIFIYNITNYNLLMVFKNNIYNFDENMFLSFDSFDNTDSDKFILKLYDISDINNIKYQNFYLNKNKFMELTNMYVPKYMCYESLMDKERYFSDIKNISKRKLLVIKGGYIFIFKYIKHLQALYAQKEKQLKEKPMKEIKEEEIEEKQTGFKTQKQTEKEILNFQNKIYFMNQLIYSNDNNDMNIYFMIS